MVRKYFSRFFILTGILIYSALNCTTSFALPTRSLAKDEWRQISIPADPGTAGTLRALLGDDLPADQYGSNKLWAVFAYDARENQYRVVGIDEVLTANTGYWIIQLVADSVTLDVPDTLPALSPRSLPGCPTDQRCASKILQSTDSSGWSMIGLSSDELTTFGETRIRTDDVACAAGCTPEAASNAELSQNQIYNFQGDEYLIVTEADPLLPWEGYWLGINPEAQAPVWLVPIREDAFGLTEREPLSDLNLPFGGRTDSNYGVENAYPNVNFNDALFAASIPSEPRLLYAERPGYLKVIEDNAAATNPRTILDITAKIRGAGGEQGLIGVALDPEFRQNRFVYVHYTIPSPLSSVISRFVWDQATDVIEPSSEKIILEVPQPYTNHNGGGLVFGPDGNLFVGLGDGGSGGDPFLTGNNGSENCTFNSCR